MTNKQIANAFSDLADIMELHNENPFKISSYRNAYITLRKQDLTLSEMSRKDLDSIKGVGKAIGDKIEELISTGHLETYQKYAEKTPSGVIDMININGFGPKKVFQVWQSLGVESVGELLYACNENRLIELKGFGKKTQEEVSKNAEYFLRSEKSQLWVNVKTEAKEIVTHIQKKLKNITVDEVGDLRRLCPTLEAIDLLITDFGHTDDRKINPSSVSPKSLSLSSIDSIFDSDILTLIEKKDDGVYVCKNKTDFPVHIYTCTPKERGSKLFCCTGSTEFLKSFANKFVGKDFRSLPTEEAIFKTAGIPFIAPEMRENTNFSEVINRVEAKQLISLGDIRGVIHTHTTYSDGVNSIAEMAHYAQKKGYGYIGITDHSKAAFYANGLKEDRLLEQWKEIDALNAEFFNFKILKGIESDILYEGRLDYSDDILSGFDFVIASIHSQLKMTEEKATARLIKAIENPFTTILGHPTGRLLLARAGYQIDHKKVIDACAANKVAIELNANPYRLDLDWAWINYARQKNVYVAINPDAHSCAGVDDILYGIFTARKGGLDAAGCLNCLNVEDFLKFSSK